MPDPAAGSPPSLRERKKAATRERIYFEALELFRRKGFAATTVEEIAAAAEVSKGTFFNYFPSKEALLHHLGERQATAMAEAVRAAQQDPRLRARDRLGHLLRRLAGNVEADRDLMRVAVFELAKAPGQLAADPYRQRLREALATLLREAQRQGDVRPGVDPALAASAIVGVYLQQVFEWCTAAEAEGLASRVDELMRLLWDGLAPG